MTFHLAVSSSSSGLTFLGRFDLVELGDTADFVLFPRLGIMLDPVKGQNQSDDELLQLSDWLDLIKFDTKDDAISSNPTREIFRH